MTAVGWVAISALVALVAFCAAGWRYAVLSRRLAEKKLTLLLERIAGMAKEHLAEKREAEEAKVKAAQVTVESGVEQTTGNLADYLNRNGGV